MSNLKKALYMLSWIPVLVFDIITFLLGLLVVPIALIMGPQSNDWHEIFWLWGNDEEGCPRWWLEVTAIKQETWFIRKFPCFWWYAIRNPVNNSRFIFKDRKAKSSGNWTEPAMEAQDLLDRKMRVAYRWSYNGPFAGYRRVWINDYGTDLVTYSEFWIGWKVGSTVPGMGFTTQYRRNRKIGT